jgi:hypothetical protein
MMLTRRSVTVGSAVVATSALALGPSALAAPARRLHARSAEGGQAVLDWERIAFRTVYAEQTPPTPVPVGVPTLGFTSLAMHRAAQRSAHLGSSSESAAVAQAAHDVLAHYYSPSTAKLDADLATTFAAIGAGHTRSKGARIGADAARDVIESRRDDGWADPTIHYSQPQQAGKWQPTAPNTDMLAPWLGSLRHLVVTPEQPSGPYPLGSTAWAADYEEVRRIGSSTSSPTDRPADQTATALFYNSSNSGMAVGDALVRYLETHPLGILATARIFAMLHAAAADSVICCWQQKRDEGFWRPFQAISGQYDDLNPGTTPQPGWAALVPMPNYSDYLSGHGSLTAPQVEVVRRVLGEDTALEMRSTAGPPRTYAHLSELEFEALNARIWGGLHFRKAMTDAYEMGHRTAERVIAALGD